MDVDVLGHFMDMLMGVRLPDGSFVRVEMVEVTVAMRVRVNGPFMPVGMRMLFTEDETDGKDHQEPGGGHRPADGLVQEEEGGERPDEGSEAEKGPGPKGPEALEGPDEEDKT
jgi:hypothetical protein